MPNMEHTLAEQTRDHPQDTFRVIVRVDDEMDARHAQLQEMGFVIARTLRLIRGFGATATGETLLKSMQQEWIVSIEPDGQVHTMGDAP